MKLLVTRPAADAAALAALLEAQGHTGLIDPLLQVKQRADEVPALDGITALIFTSANGVRAFATASERRDLPAFVVGDRTAKAAKSAGFGTVRSAEGDVEALIRLIRAERTPAEGALLHISGTVRAGNLAETLTAAGYTVHHQALYEAEPAGELAQATRAAIASGTLDGVLLFSPRTARQFVALVEQADLSGEMRRLEAWCLSSAVAKALAGLSFADIHVAAKPTQAALLDALRRKDDRVSVEPPAPSSDPHIEGALPPSPQWRTSKLGALAVVAVLLLIVAGSSPWWLPFVAPSVSTGTAEPQQTAATPPVPEPAAPAPPALYTSTRDEMTAVQTQLGDLNQRLDALAARPAFDPQPVQGIASDLQRVSNDMAQLSTRVANVEARVNQKSAEIRTDRTLVLAAGQIRDALVGSGPFEAPVAVIRAVAPDDQALTAALGVLDRHAKSGVPSRLTLAQDLTALPGKLSAPAPPPPDAGLWDRMTDRMSRLVTVRRVDDGSTKLPAGPDRIILNAEQTLAAGDLAGAVKMMQTLSGHDAEIAKPWLDGATARQEAEHAAATLEAMLIQRLSQPDTGGKPE
jgi:uroporphyrinogen-III synthase